MDQRDTTHASAAQTPTLETPEQKKDRKRQLVAIGIIIAAVASIAIFKSIDFSKDDTETAAAETTTTQAARTTTTARTTTAGAATTPLTTSAVPTSTTLPVSCANLEAAASRMQDAGAVDN